MNYDAIERDRLASLNAHLISVNAIIAAMNCEGAKITLYELCGPKGVYFAPIFIERSYTNSIETSA
jgi:hypothetical protein